ncbi:MAG: GNAT family N-acetyltransferase [Erysipelotrichaceae bacterium]|nr:GNAT family N-acetyltransferase [Erysipelotrichaceae bacterium]MDD3924054.1 GNAT family N-acetyltransferase [Erysipelotrichaceae bacterium]MDD4642338.1 GNAT family N-acetyltransferase [Erysipelotrichaceae bacterium]
MIVVKEVTSKKELRKFVNFPNQLYKDNPYFVPATYADDLNDWNSKKNPAFDYCEAKCFLAYKDDMIVGRIGAILSHKSNRKWNTKRMRFSQVDFIDDDEVVDALFKTVEEYALSKGCDEVHGPLGFTDLDREGMLVEGFDQINLFFTYYNHPYYNQQLARLGYVKDVDWIEYRLFSTHDMQAVEKISVISDRLKRMYKLHEADLKTHIGVYPYIKKMFSLLNIAYAPLYSVVDLNDKQIKHYVNKFLPMINMDYVSFVMDENNDMVGFGICAPSMNEAFKATNGRLLPFGFIKVLKAMKHNDTLNMFLIAVHPDYQGKGINAIIIEKILKNAIKNGIKFAETGPMLETNEKIQSQWKRFDKIQHKRRRCYIKKIK